MNISNILARYSKDNSRNGEIAAGFKESTPTTVYSKEDDSGTSYVFAGVNPNNWVKLGDIYFRIIRFNGDGSLRLIYSGDGTPQEKGFKALISEKEFNLDSSEPAYVGLQYTLGEVHGNSTNSTILGEENSLDATTLYGWYNSKIKPNYENIIDSNSGFCVDREPSTDNSVSNGLGGNGEKTYYGAYIRFMPGLPLSETTSSTPTLKCKNASDNLNLPVGLITGDEFVLSGGGLTLINNETFWLNIGEQYWTLSPNFSTYRAYVSNVTDKGSFLGKAVNVAIGVRPVINLKSDVIFLNDGGNGTSSNPYVVKS